MDTHIKDTQPLVTIFMNTYNGEKYLDQSIRSILSQTYTNFEFIIMDDCSTDSSVNIIKSYTDPRIQLIANQKNMGHTYGLNYALENATGKYVANMDQDDISLPIRIATQVEFMETHPNIAMCGTWVKTIGSGRGYVNRLFTDPEDIKANLLFYSSIAHPSVMFRKSDTDAYGFRYKELGGVIDSDYSMWVEMTNSCLIANIPKVLFRYRINPLGLSHTYSTEQRAGAANIKKIQLEKMGLRPSDEDLVIHNATRPEYKNDIGSFLKKSENWLLKIIEANNVSRIYKAESLRKVIYRRWYAICDANTSHGLAVWQTFQKSPLFQFGNDRKTKMINSMKMCVKCCLRK